jgi:nucleoside-diphosphate-sugar epimerase
MKVLFIGGTGNISSEVSKLAVMQGIDLFLLNRNKTSKSYQGTQSIAGDARNKELLASVVREHSFDCVVNWIAYDEEHIAEDIEVFQGYVGQYIFISSASTYQKVISQKKITEELSLENPYWEYSRKKIACEKLLLRAFSETGFPVTIVRPSHTYNVTIPLPVTSGYTGINRLKEGKPFVVHDEGKTLWTLTHAQDFARGFLGLIGLPEAIGEAYHITSDETLTWNKIVRITAEALGVEPKIIHIPAERIAEFIPSVGSGLLGDKRWPLCFDNSKIKKAVPGYKAKVAFAKGIRQTLAWYQMNPEYQIVNYDLDAQVDSLVAEFTTT